MSGSCKNLDAVEIERLITLLHCIRCKIKKVVSNQLPDDIEKLLNISKGILNFDVDIETELLEWASHAKAVFCKVSHLLDLPENLSKILSQDTHGKQLFSHKESAYNEPCSQFNYIKHGKIPKSISFNFTKAYQEHSNVDQDHKEPFGVIHEQHVKMMKLKDQNLSLQKQLESLKIKNHQYEEILFEFGKVTVEETAKRNEERKSNVFHQIYGGQSSKAKKPNNYWLGRPIPRTSLVEVERCVTSVCSVDRTNSVPQATNESAAHPINTLVAKASISDQQHPNGAKAMAKGCNHHGKEKETGKLEALGKGDSLMTWKDWDDVSLASMQSSDLSFSSQQDNSRLSLSTTPSTPAAPTVNNNYKLLLPTLAQRLLSSEVVVLKDWAAQNFSIVITQLQNATDVFFQLDEKQVINASDLGRLCDFFESILRFDLMYIVDAFLLGDYSLLHQNSASKQQNTNSAHNSGHASTSGKVNLEPLSIHPAATAVLQTSEDVNLTAKPENSGGGLNFVHPPTQKASERRNAVGAHDPQPTMSSNLQTSNAKKNEARKVVGTIDLSSACTSVATTLYNNYKLLLLTLAQRLFSSEFVALKDWAAQNFSIVNSQNAFDLFFQLDEKQVINASDLGQLCKFFESIIRFDLVYIVDAFLLGDYSLLRQHPESRSMNGAQNSEHEFASGHEDPLSSHPAAIGVLQTSEYRNSVAKPQNSGAAQNSVHPQHQEASERRDIVGIQSSNQGYGILQGNHAGKNAPVSTKPKNCAGAGNFVPQQTEQASQNSSEEVNSNVCNEIANEYSSTIHEEQNHYHIAARFGTNTTVDVDTAGHPHLSELLTNSARNTQPSSTNTSTPSTLQPSDTEQTVSDFQSSRASVNQHLPREQNWPCSHFKRVGLVKFECCEKFWPCHRCHNNQRACGQRKSHNAIMVKCVNCNTEQQFCQTCHSCGTKFANYYCELCKHLTGKDNSPYHCDKCGTCRIRGDRSFHCDVCGLCFDNEYRQYHIHDKCCICLKDAFTRCPILPCSHKFHEECVNVETIHRRFIWCNICGQSFDSNYLTRSL